MLFGRGPSSGPLMQYLTSHTPFIFFSDFLKSFWSFLGRLPYLEVRSGPWKCYPISAPNNENYFYFLLIPFWFLLPMKCPGLQWKSWWAMKSYQWDVQACNEKCPMKILMSNEKLPMKYPGLQWKVSNENPRKKWKSYQWNCPGLQWKVPNENPGKQWKATNEMSRPAMKSTQWKSQGAMKYSGLQWKVPNENPREKWKVTNEISWPAMKSAQ